MKIAVAQIACALGDVVANLEKIRVCAQRAKANGAELVLFPEMSDTGYAMPIIREQASAWKDGAVAQIREMARNLSITIAAGVSEREGDRIFNSLIVIDAQGEIISSYRKTHLFAPAPIEEHKCFAAGGELGSFARGELQFAPSICYDLRFPELYRTQVTHFGANVFLLASAWPFPRAEHLRTLALARAIENQSYLVLANRVGQDAGVMFCGGSAIIDPYGVIVAAASAEREEVLHAEIADEVVRAVRARMPVLEHRREEIYRGPKLPNE